jgi:amino acid transporter
MPIASSAQTTKRTLKIVPALWLFLASVAILTLAAYPMYVIRPFREQGPAALQRALWLLLYNKPISLTLASLIAAPALFLWGRAGWITKVLLGSAIGVAMLATAATWINPFERMFHPLGEPRYLPASLAKIDANDMIIAVTVGGESRAYPIREMGYHHIVNDRLHGLPIVVTY